MTPSLSVDVNDLDSTVHGPVRLGVLAALRLDGPLDFSTLKKRFKVTDGALGMHMTKLEEAAYVRVKKRFIGRKPKTTYAITPAGSKALSKYLQSMRQLLDEIEKSPRAMDTRTGARDSQVRTEVHPTRVLRGFA